MMTPRVLSILFTVMTYYYNKLLVWSLVVVYVYIYISSCPRRRTAASCSTRAHYDIILYVYIMYIYICWNMFPVRKLVVALVRVVVVLENVWRRGHLSTPTVQCSGWLQRSPRQIQDLQHGGNIFRNRVRARDYHE